MQEGQSQAPLRRVRNLERGGLRAKPRYVDFESPSLQRTLARFLAPVRERAPSAAVTFTEMLPGPGDCWLQGDTGRHTSELRIVAVDRCQAAAAAASPELSGLASDTVAAAAS